MIQIRIPDFVRQVQISKTRKKKYFDNPDPETYPKKYQNNKRYGFKEGKLYDFVDKEFIVKNSNLLDKPRFIQVNGNVIMRAHKDVVWRKVIPALDKMFTTALSDSTRAKGGLDFFRVPFPWKISMDFRVHYGYADWDIDNPWIYEKCFNDALKRFLDFDDSILKITNGGEKRFRPVRSFEREELVIKIETDHAFSWPTGKVIKVTESPAGKPGDVLYSYTAECAIIYTGKKKPVYGKAREAIRKLMFKALNDMVSVSVTGELWTRYHDCWKEYEKFNVKVKLTLE